MSFAQPFKNYEILDRVGAGAMGTVFKARQKHLGRIVALKVLKPSLARDARYVERLRREARIVGRLNHPNIVTAYDLGEEGGYHFFVMEFVEGQSLRELLTEWGHFPESQVLDVGTQIAEALAHAFDCGVIHRDIKPANVLIDGDGRVKLTDMGLAKAKTDLTLTRDGATVGTPQYISPEQAKNPRDVDVRSDLYSLGASLFHMATGQPPFRGETIGELISQVLHEPAPSAHDLDPTISEGLSLVIRKLMSKDPGLRYQSPRELLVDLHRVQRHERPEVDRAVLLEGTDAEGASLAGDRRTRWLVGGLVGVGLLLAALLGLGAFGGGVGSGAGDPGAERGALGLPAELRRVLEIEAPGARLVAIRKALPLVEDSGDVEVLERAATNAVAESRAASEAVVGRWLGDEREATVAALADPAEWPSAVEFVSTIVEPALDEALGSPLAGLPDASLVASIERSRSRLGLALAELTEARDRELLRAYRTWLTETVQRGVEAALTAGRFRAADAALAAIGSAYLDGRDRPARAELGAAVLARIEDLEERTRVTLGDRIRTARSAAAGRLLSETTAARAAFQTRIDAGRSTGISPQGLALDVRRFVTELRSSHPSRSALGSAAGVWDRVDGEIAQLELTVEQWERSFEDAAFASALRLAHRVFADAGPGPAAAVLEIAGSLRGAVEADRQAHRRLFLGVEEFLREVARARAPEGLQLSTVSGGAAVLTLGDSGELRMRGAELSPGGWRDVTWDRAFGEADLPAEVLAVWAERAGLRAGRAFLWMVADEPARALESVDAETAAFLQNAVWPLLSAPVESVAAGERAARDAFRRLVEAYRAGDSERVRALLTEFELRHGRSEAARNGAPLRARIVGSLEAEERGSGRLADLQGRCPEGMVAAIDDLDRPTCRGDLGGIGGVVIGPGWRRAERAIGFGIEGTLAAGFGELSVLGPFGPARPQDLEIEVGLAVEAEPRLQVFGLAVHGAALALVVLPDGELLVVPMARLQDLRDPEELGRLAASPLRDLLVGDDGALRGVGDVAVMVPGAWHRLTLRVEPRRDGDARIRVWLDDARRVLWDGPVSRPDEEDAAAFRCLTATKLRLRELRFVGRGAD